VSVIGHLHRRAAQAVLPESEKASIGNSLTVLRTRLKLHFGNTITTAMIFGSFRRGTILPRSMDAESDVDLLVGFKESGFKPQTYLDRLRRFVELRYPRSISGQANPTVKLELNHIIFELVPGLPGSWPGRDFLIPDGPDQWQITEPIGFQRQLEQANLHSGGRLKPAIRLLKYWNALNGYPWDSYKLEKWAVGLGFGSHLNVADYFFALIDALPDQYDAQWKVERVARAKRIVNSVRDNIRYHYGVTAEQEVQRLIPQ
jgi:predicted nucleotidyltransferase